MTRKDHLNMWVPPPTLTPGDAITAAHWNQFIRDNMNATEPAKATGGGMIMASGLGRINERFVVSDLIGALDHTESTSWDSLWDTIGPEVETDCGTSALVLFSSAVSNGVVDGIAFCSFIVQNMENLDGQAPAIEEPTHERIIHYRSPQASRRYRGGLAVIVETVPGRNRFTMVYRVASGRGIYADREIVVIPL